MVPSRGESLPYVVLLPYGVLEAAAAGKPLISTNVGGIPEIYGPLAPALVPAGDTPALAAAIAQAVDNPEATNTIAQKLRAQVAASFSADDIVDGVLAGYRQAIETRAGATAWRTNTLRMMTLRSAVRISARRRRARNSSRHGTR